MYYCITHLLTLSYTHVHERMSTFTEITELTQATSTSMVHTVLSFVRHEGSIVIIDLLIMLYYSLIEFP